MDLLSLSQAEARGLVARGFDVVGRVNTLVLPLVFPEGPEDLQLGWNEMRTLMLCFRETPTARGARVMLDLFILI